jgi:hypothetical protein
LDLLLRFRQNPMKLILLVLLPLILFNGCRRNSAGAAAPPANVSDVGIDPPGRVARVSLTSGAVSFRAAGVEGWVAAEVNRPLTTGDELWTDDNARAELDLGHTFIRLDSRTSLTILNLDDRGVQISLAEGTVAVRLRELDEKDEFEVATPHAALLLLRTGDYRFGVPRGAAETRVTVRSGQVEATAPGQAFSIRAQQQARLTGTEKLQYEIAGAPPLDSFDDFCRTRDRRAERAESLQHVSPRVIGREDLDEHGAWRVDVTWGPVWYPRVVAPGWAPYRFGHWVWIEPWGWTWIDESPWGFAPFHYGRWAFIGGYWGWVPGPSRIRPVYAPALVVFAGGGPGHRYYVSIGAGLGVGWFPLGPREVYLPPYRASRIYVTNINVSHTVIANPNDIWRRDVTRQHYVNRDVSGAFTAVPEDVFAHGRPVSRAAVPVSPERARSFRIGGSAPPVTPTRGSIAPAPEGSRPSPRPPEATRSRPTTIRRPAPPAPVPFEAKRPALDRDPGRPPDPGRVEELRRQQPRPETRHRQVPAPVPAPNTPRRQESPAVRQPTLPESRRRGIEQERRRAAPSRSPAPSGRRP